MAKTAVGKTVIRFVQGDITQQDTDAIVNAANSSLMGGGGVDGAIHQKGGSAILSECEEIRRTTWKDGLPPGEAVITSGGSLKARYVIHTVGPVWQGGSNNEEKLLTNCYWNSLKLAESMKLTSIAFPAIGTGAYGYPPRCAAILSLRAVKGFLESHNDTTLQEVVFVLFSIYNLNVYKEVLNIL